MHVRSCASVCLFRVWVVGAHTGYARRNRKTDRGLQIGTGVCVMRRSQKRPGWNGCGRDKYGLGGDGCVNAAAVRDAATCRGDRGGAEVVYDTGQSAGTTASRCSVLRQACAWVRMLGVRGELRATGSAPAVARAREQVWVLVVERGVRGRHRRAQGGHRACVRQTPGACCTS